MTLYQLNLKDDTLGAAVAETKTLSITSSMARAIDHAEDFSAKFNDNELEWKKDGDVWRAIVSQVATLEITEMELDERRFELD